MMSVSVEEKLQLDLQAKWLSGRWSDMHKKHELSPVVQLKIEDWVKQGGFQAIQRKLQIHGYVQVPHLSQPAQPGSG